MCHCVCLCVIACACMRVIVCACVIVCVTMLSTCMYHCHSQTSTQEIRKKKEAEYEMLSNPVKGYAGKVMTLLPIRAEINVILLQKLLELYKMYFI